jgi:hypothetical protein
MRSSAFVLLAALAPLLHVAGCASGGAHDHDAGSPIDSGPPMDTNADAVATSDTGAVDVGVDSGPAPHDGGAIVRMDSGGHDSGCTSSAACSDGLVCNGVETCLGGACVAGHAPMCDDGIGCTDDSCAEPGGCVHTPNNTRCGTGMMCTSNGCVSTSTCSETPCRFNPPQCGCPTGQACYATATSAQCQMPGTGASGTVCANGGDCVGGDMCVNFGTSTTPARLCSQICLADTDCGGGLCIYTINNGMGGTVPNLVLCSHPCNVAAQTGCPTGWSCNVLQEPMGMMRAYTDCVSTPGTGTTNATCTTDTDCAAGFACVDTQDPMHAGTRCHHWCRYPAGTECTGGQVCVNFSPDLVINTVDYGVCTN